MLLDNFSITSSALSAERFRLQLISENIANINTTRSKSGGPYQRQVALFAEKMELASKGFRGATGSGVQVSQVVKSKDTRQEYNPTHPDANAQGIVLYPDINLVNEMVDLISASRSYEANVTVLNATKSMALKALEIGR